MRRSRKKKRASDAKEARRRSAILILVLFLLVHACGGGGDEGLYVSAQSFWDKKKFALAARDYEQFALTNPGHRKAALSLYKAASIQACYLSSPHRAAEILLRLTRSYPESPFLTKAHEELAEIYARKLKKYSQAIFQYQEILDLKKGSNEDLSGILYGIGRCHSLEGDWNQALAAYRLVLKKYPSGHKADCAAYQAGYTTFLLGRYQEAEEAFRLFLRQYPDSKWAFDGMHYLAKAKEKKRQPAAVPGL